MRIQRIDRYLISEIIGPFIAALLFLFGLLLTMQLLRGIDVMLGSGVRPLDMLRIIAYLAPHFMAMAMPVSFLFALILGVGRWSEDRELLALAASGVAPWRLWIAPLALAVTVALVGITLGRSVEPLGLAALRLHVNELIKRNMAGDVRPGVFYDTINDITLYAQGVSPKTRRFSNVLLSDERDPDATLLVLAHEGQVDPHGGGGTLSLAMADGEIHRGSAQADDYAVITFQKSSLSFGVRDDLLRRNSFSAPRDEMTLSELRHEEEQARAQGEDHRALAAAIVRTKRLAAPLATVAFALCGVPLAMRGRGRSRAMGAVWTLLVYVGFYVVARAAEVSADHDRLAPWVAAHVANVLFALLGVVLAHRVARAEG